MITGPLYIYLPIHFTKHRCFVAVICVRLSVCHILNTPFVHSKLERDKKCIFSRKLPLRLRKAPHFPTKLDTIGQEILENLHRYMDNMSQWTHA